MKVRVTQVLATLALVWASVAPGAVVRPHKTIELFKSFDTNDCYTWLVDTKYADPRHVFIISNGMLRISGDGLDYIATRDEFADYKLALEFKWGTNNTHWGDRVGKARDSGVFLHATGPDGNSDDGNGAFMAAIECNVFQGATGDFLLIRGTDLNHKLIAPRVTVETAPARDSDGWPRWQPGGGRLTIQRWGRVNWRSKSAEWRDETDFRATHDVEQRYGEWNHLEITCDGDRIEILLNGKKVNEAFDVWPRAGKILLQCEGSEIFYRHVRVNAMR